MQRFFAEILRPFPAGDIDLDWAAHRVDARCAVTTKDDRAKVAGVHLVDADDIEIGLGELFGGKGNFHAINARGVKKALHMIAETENGGALRGVVAADAFKDRRAVCDDVREDVNLGVVPLDHFAVVPNVPGLGKAHGVSPRGEFTLLAPATRKYSSVVCRSMVRR